MPEISRFYGIVIYMYWKDHAPPHFHVQYNEYTASILIENYALTNGNLPSKALALVVEWASIHQKELLENWESMSVTETNSYKKIKPLQ